MSMNAFLHYDVIVAFFAFMCLRYYLPNIVLGKPTSVWAAFVLSFCYGLTAYIRANSKLVAKYLPEFF